MKKLILILIFILVNASCDKPEIISSNFNIISLKSDKFITGSFFLGIGSIGQYEYYIGYRKYKNGFKRFIIPVNYSYIIETNEESPKIIIKYTNMYPHLLNIETIISGKLKDLRGTGFKILDIKIIVPENTIIRKFELE